MNYPESLKKGDTIGICAPSAGIIDEYKVKRLDLAIQNLESLGYKVIETESVRKDNNGRSSSKEKRAKEFMELIENEKVKLVLFAAGGDFEFEILDELDFEKLKKLPPKWIQGYSDNTNLGFLFNTILEVPSIYCDGVGSYAMNPLYKNLEDAISVASGKEVIQQSFKKYEKRDFEIKKNTNGYNLTEKVEWKNLKGEEKIEITGRSIGGCFDIIEGLIGTRYDHIKEYLEKYKNDGFIWFLECFEMSSAQVERKIWQMKSAGYFKYAKGIVFGRPLFCREDYDVNFVEAVKNSTEELQIPIITGADIGHLPPQLAIVNGAILKIVSENGKATVETFFK